MKIFAYLTLIIAIVCFGIGCAQPSANETDHSKMDHNSMNHNSINSNMNHDGMNHSEMKSDANAASAPYDLQFIDTMIAHHQGAVDMAKMVESKTQNADLRNFSARIISDQEKEIAQMKDWREKWFAGKPRAMNMNMRGMADSMKMDMKEMSNSKDQEFDSAFVEMMIPHHLGAVEMSEEALQKSERPEIKALANQIIKAQRDEIKMMEEWKNKWSK